MGQVRQKQAEKGVTTYTYCAGESLRTEISTGGAVHTGSWGILGCETDVHQERTQNNQSLLVKTEKSIRSRYLIQELTANYVNLQRTGIFQKFEVWGPLEKNWFHSR